MQQTQYAVNNGLEFNNNSGINMPMLDVGEDNDGLDDLDHDNNDQ